MPNDKPSLDIKSAEVNFIYSFIPVCNFTLLRNHKINEVFPKNNYLFPDLDLLKKMFPKSIMGNPDEAERNGELSAYLALQHSIGSESLPIIECQFDADNERKIKITIKPILRFFPTGCSCNLSVNIGEKNKHITHFVIHDLLNLVGNIENEKAQKRLTATKDYPYLEIEEKMDFSIFDIYKKIINKKETVWKEETIENLVEESTDNASLKDAHIKILCRDYLLFRNGPINKNEFDDYNLVSTLCKLNILEFDKNDIHSVYFKDSITDKDKLEERLVQKELDKDEKKNQEKKEIVLDVWDHGFKPVPEPQYPCVMINLELSEGNAFCSSFYNKDGTISYNDKQEAIRKYEDLIAPLLFRAPIDNINKWETEPAYLYSSGTCGKKGFYNMFLNSKLFVHITRRSILTISNSFKEKPASFILPTLKNISEITHSRWQTLVILNKMIDKLIRRFSYNKIAAEEKLENMITMINLYSCCLEDPNIYVVSGNALREINEEIINTFNLNGLADALIKKIDLLEKVYRRSTEKRMFRKYSDDSGTNKI